MCGAAGLEDPSDFLPRHFMTREKDRVITEGDEAFPYQPIGFLLREEADDQGYLIRWNRARADNFAPID